MKRKVAICFMLFLLLAGHVVQAQSDCFGTLVWNDEFDGPDLDMDKWSYDTGNGCPNLCGWGNGELQYYTDRPENVRIENGVLILEARDDGYAGADFSSGKIITRNKFQRTYGRFEARMRQPQGLGMWPAFWMLRHDNAWPMTGEIDIMEYRGDEVNSTHGTVHYGSAWPNNQWDGTTHNHGAPLYADFHTYAVEWDPDGIRWYFDDILFKTLTRDPNNLNPQSTDDPWPWEEDFWIILNLAVGGWFTGTTDPNTVELTKPTLEIDYVRVYDLGPPDPEARSPFGGTPTELPGIVQAEEFDEGCPDIVYYDTDPANQGGAFRNEQVDIEETEDVGGGYNVGWIETGEWMEYTVNVSSPGTYDLDFRIASDGGGGALRIEMNGTDVTGTVAVPNTNGWQTWQTVSLEEVPLTAGVQVMRIYIEAGGFNLNYVNFEGNTLPVTWLAFTGEQNSGSVELFWQTTDEVDNDHFDVERSGDGVNFSVIGMVPGTGTGSGVYDYDFTDTNPQEGTNYYRLAQYDTDGTVLYSAIISVLVDPLVLGVVPPDLFAHARVYPNPASDYLSVDLQKGPLPATITMYNIQGVAVKEEAAREQTTRIWVGDLPSGSYILEISDDRNYRRLVVMKQ